MNLVQQVQIWEDDQRTRFDSAFKEWILELYKRIIQLSPVDTGHFRANWQVSKEEPNFETTESTETQTPSLTGFKYGDIVYFSNGLPYAEMLEKGGWKPPKYKPGQDRKVTNRNGTVIAMMPKTTESGYSVQAPLGILKVIEAEAADLWTAMLSKHGLAA